VLLLLLLKALVHSAHKHSSSRSPSVCGLPQHSQQPCFVQAAEGESEMCWICLEEASEDGSHQMVAPCKCPRKVHPQCLARWQLQQAGRHEEKFCRCVLLSLVEQRDASKLDHNAQHLLLPTRQGIATLLGPMDGTTVD